MHAATLCVFSQMTCQCMWHKELIKYICSIIDGPWKKLYEIDDIHITGALFDFNILIVKCVFFLRIYINRLSMKLDRYNSTLYLSKLLIKTMLNYDNGTDRDWLYDIKNIKINRKDCTWRKQALTQAFSVKLFEVLSKYLKEKYFILLGSLYENTYYIITWKHITRRKEQYYKEINVLISRKALFRMCIISLVHVFLFTVYSIIYLQHEKMKGYSFEILHFCIV